MTSVLVCSRLKREDTNPLFVFSGVLNQDELQQFVFYVGKARGTEHGVEQKGTESLQQRHYTRFKSHLKKSTSLRIHNSRAGMNESKGALLQNTSSLGRDGLHSSDLRDFSCK